MGKLTGVGSKLTGVGSQRRVAQIARIVNLEKLSSSEQGESADDGTARQPEALVQLLSEPGQTHSP